MNRYVRAWDRLADAVKFVMTAGDMETEARRGLCQAISDGTLAIRVYPGKNVRTLMNASGTVLDGKDVEIPTRLCPDDFDWNNSRPLQPWAVRRDRSRQLSSGGCYWHIDCVEVSKSDLLRLFCEPQAQNSTCVRGAGGPAKEPAVVPLGRRRGRNPIRLERPKEAMRKEIPEKRQSARGTQRDAGKGPFRKIRRGTRGGGPEAAVLSELQRLILDKCPSKRRDFQQTSLARSLDAMERI
jgi:hypothetical protein